MEVMTAIQVLSIIFLLVMILALQLQITGITRAIEDLSSKMDRLLKTTQQ